MLLFPSFCLQAFSISSFIMKLPCYKLPLPQASTLLKLFVKPHNQSVFQVRFLRRFFSPFASLCLQSKHITKLQRYFHDFYFTSCAGFQMASIWNRSGYNWNIKGGSFEVQSIMQLKWFLNCENFWVQVHEWIENEMEFLFEAISLNRGRRCWQFFFSSKNNLNLTSIDVDLW